jgi:hypothetical protein
MDQPEIPTSAKANATEGKHDRQKVHKASPTQFALHQLAYGGAMDSSETQYLFKETRLNLEPPSSSVVSIRVPAGSGRGANGNGYGSASRRAASASDAIVEDENTFRTKNLAAAASIYHRQWHESPRSFLWRVLENNTVLSIRTVDVCKKDKAPDTPLVLNFIFETPIQPNCVAFADPEVHDSLCVFVLDQAYQLWTFTLRPDLFRKRSAVDAGLSDLAKRHSPAGLSFKHPHRLVAVSADTLLVTVNDGGMIRFDRTRGDDSELQAAFLCVTRLVLIFKQAPSRRGRKPSSMCKDGPRTCAACSRSRESTRSSTAKSTWSTVRQPQFMSPHSVSTTHSSQSLSASIIACASGTSKTARSFTLATYSTSTERPKKWASGPLIHLSRILFR